MPIQAILSSADPLDGTLGLWGAGFQRVGESMEQANYGGVVGYGRAPGEGGRGCREDEGRVRKTADGASTWRSGDTEVATCDLRP